MSDRSACRGRAGLIRLMVAGLLVMAGSTSELLGVDCHDRQDSEEVLESGQRDFYQSEWQDARICFRELQRRSPEDPVGFFMESMIPFWEYYFVSRDSELASQFFDLSEEAIVRAERQLQSNPETTGAIAMLSGLYGYRSLVASKEGAIREAFRSGRRGYEYTQQLMNLESSNPEIDIGRGIYHYMAGSVPGSLRWLAHLFGLRGEKQTGVEYLEQAAGSDSFSRLDARLILSVIYKREGLEKSALRHLDKLLSIYEKNRIFLLLKADLLMEMGAGEEAIRLYDQLIDRADPRWERLVIQARERSRALRESRS